VSVFRRVDTVSKSYDVHLFEELQADKLGMHEYIYNYRKLWSDQKHRNTLDQRGTAQRCLGVFIVVPLYP